jgi:hypothetical protein
MSCIGSHAILENACGFFFLGWRHGIKIFCQKKYYVFQNLNAKKEKNTNVCIYYTELQIACSSLLYVWTKPFIIKPQFEKKMFMLRLIKLTAAEITPSTTSWSK